MLTLTSLRRAQLLSSTSHRVLVLVMPADTEQLARAMRSAWIKMARG